MKAALTVFTLLAGLWSSASTVAAQGVARPAHLTRDDPALSSAMARVADELLQARAPIVPGERFRLELAAGRYKEAAESLAKIRDGRRLSDPALLLNLRWEIYARARTTQRRQARRSPPPYKRRLPRYLNGWTA